MDYMFKRWVRLSTVLALVKPKRDKVTFIRFYTEDDATKKHNPWIENCTLFELKGTGYGNEKLAEIANNFVAKTITIDRVHIDPTTDGFLIEVEEKK